MKLGITDNEFMFLFLGNCRRYKNIHELIRTFRKIPGPARLLVVGKFHEESYRKEISALVAERNDQVAVIATHIADDDLQIYLNASDAVVLPYSEILTSGAAMLAISFGRPVVAPNAGYLTDVINDDCGLLYEREDPEGLLKAMTRAQDKSFHERSIIQHTLTYDWGRIADIVWAKLAQSGARQAGSEKIPL
jgi:glycosyltransferase involved in cell wall biosynthesis